MAENRISGGRLITLEGCTAFSNIAAGTLLAVNTASNGVYSFCRETTGLNTAGSFGMRFLGVLDDDISAGQVCFNVWTEGIFRVRLQLANTASVTVGQPVFPGLSGAGLGVVANTGGTAAGGVLNVTGTQSIGTVVGRSASGTAGEWIDIVIKPNALLWGPYAMAATTGLGNNYPPSL